VLNASPLQIWTMTASPTMHRASAIQILLRIRSC